jgi:L-threonylcarbamoyladenylate synthase
LARVNTIIYKIRDAVTDGDILRLAAEKLKAGGLVAFPTETVYGLGANALDRQAVERIFAAKGRPFFDPLIVHISETRQLEQVVLSPTQLAIQLAQAFWPGPLTLILPRNPQIPGIVSAGLPTVAVRNPDHPIALGLIRSAGVPVAAPSANRFMRPSPTIAQHVLEDLKGEVDIILDGGPCPIGVESTVLDITGKQPVILRPGGLSIEKLRQVAPDVILQEKFIQEGGEGAASPGMYVKHYAPDARLIVVSGSTEATGKYIYRLAKEFLEGGLEVGILVADEDAKQYEDIPVKLENLGSRQDLEKIAANLFAAIRSLDQLPVDIILVGEFSTAGLGLAIRDRLVRAAAGQVIRVD